MLASDSEHVRLHITPLNNKIYSRIISAPLAEKISNVSLHAVQTFPERGYGFVDMARTDAERLKKKLNGLTLKGTKIRIEDAKPKLKRKSDAGGGQDDQARTTRKKTKSKIDRSAGPKSGKTQGLLAGHQLEDDRHVKRAWTSDLTTKSKDRRTVKVAADDERVSMDKRLLFKTSVPPNKTGVEVQKQSKNGNKITRSGADKTVVEEFSHNRKSFMLGRVREKEAKPVMDYVDGKGWVDEDGKLVEAETRNTRLRAGQQAAVAGSRISTNRAQKQTLVPSPSAQPEQLLPARRVLREAPRGNVDFDNAASEDGSTTILPSDVGPADIKSKQQVHPLEALYKRPSSSETKDLKLDLAPINTSFSFFGADADPNTNDQGSAEIVRETCPQTPHTKQEFEWRAQRSAAPTPDTAAIDGRFGFPFGPDDDDDEEVEDRRVNGNDDDDDDNDDNDNSRDDDAVKELSPSRPPAARHSMQPDNEESEFRKYFYEHRGENDRAWKRKRREAKKQQRQRENRRLSRRVV